MLSPVKTRCGPADLVRSVARMTRVGRRLPATRCPVRRARESGGEAAARPLVRWATEELRGFL